MELNVQLTFSTTQCNIPGTRHAKLQHTAHFPVFGTRGSKSILGTNSSTANCGASTWSKGWTRTMLQWERKSIFQLEYSWAEREPFQNAALNNPVSWCHTHAKHVCAQSQCVGILQRVRRAQMGKGVTSRKRGRKALST